MEELRQLNWLIYNTNMKGCARSFLKPFFLVRAFFLKLSHKIFISLSDIIGLENFFLSFGQS